MKEIDNFKDWSGLWNGEIIPQSLSISLHQNEPVLFTNGDKSACGYLRGGVIRQFKNQYSPSGISAKNGEQLAALNLLGDDSVPLTILTGAAGSGKTLLSIAHALEKFMNNGKTKQIMIAKSMTPVGREIGFLKGELEDKIKPWLGPFYDNFKVCGQSHSQVEKLIEQRIVEISPITFIQGRSIRDTVLIIDEVQNLDINTIKQLITRAADNTEVILLGDPTQRFEKEDANPLRTLINAAENSILTGHVHLETCFRSPLASWAVESL